MNETNPYAAATPRPWQISVNFSQPLITNGHKTLAMVVNHNISNLVSEEEAEANALLIWTAVNEFTALRVIEHYARLSRSQPMYLVHLTTAFTVLDEIRKQNDTNRPGTKVEDRGSEDAAG